MPTGEYSRRATGCRHSGVRVVSRIAPLLLFAAALVGCDSPSTAISTSATTSTQPPTTATDTTTATTSGSLPTLPTDPTYQTVIDVTSTASTGGSGNSVQQTVGSFTATKPYMVLVACVGSGTLTVNFDDGSLSLPCTSSGALTSDHVGSPQQQQHSVSVKVTGDFSYHVEIQVEN